MHRLPLYLTSPSISWNRRLPEFDTFERTLLYQNVREFETLLTTLDEENFLYLENSKKHAAEQLKKVHILIESKDPIDISNKRRVVNDIILRAPKDSAALLAALRLRGNMYFEDCHFEDASKDYEMFLWMTLSQHKSGIFDKDAYIEVNGNMVICCYLMRKYAKAKLYLREYTKHRAGQLSEDSVLHQSLGKIECHIARFCKELNKIEDVLAPFANNVNLIAPLGGFNTSKDIPLTSSACYYISEMEKSEKPAGVYANYSIPAGNIVLVEHPIIHNVNTPLVQCELCFHRTDCLYTCLDCRYKTYCSLKCIEKDKTLHKNECIGYQCLLLILLDASHLFRIFLRTSELLHEKIFIHRLFRKVNSAKEVMQHLDNVLRENNIRHFQYLNMLSTKPDYEALSDSQYSTVVATAFRLAFFVEKKTMAIESFYSSLNISDKQKIIVVGAIIMRLNCYLLNNTFDFEYNYPHGVKKTAYKSVRDQIHCMVGFSEPLTGSVVNDINDYYKVDLQRDISQRTTCVLQMSPVDRTTSNLLTTPEHTVDCNSIHRLLSTYKDNIIRLFFCPDAQDFLLRAESSYIPTTQTTATFICSQISIMSDIQRKNLVQMCARNFNLHYADYFLRMKNYQQPVKQILGLLCTTLRKFRHSCVPNVEVVVLENGLVMGKTLCDIKKGDELLVSYKANYMRHTREQREQFLKRLNLECSCKCCSMSDLLEPSNIRQAIYCDTCEGVEVSPALGKCPKCRSSFKNLNLKYRNEMTTLEIEMEKNIISKADDRELYILHMMSYKHAQRHFVQCNELRIRVELKFAQFLAFKNFAQQSHEILMTIQTNLISNYDKQIIWFTFYSEMLMIIKTILYNNLEDGLYSLSPSSLLDLCKLGLYIINGQRNQTLLYETFDYECGPILADLRLFNVWKEKIYYNDILPLSESFNKNTRKTLNSRDLEVLPTLSKPF